MIALWHGWVFWVVAQFLVFRWSRWSRSREGYIIGKYRFLGLFYMLRFNARYSCVPFRSHLLFILARFQRPAPVRHVFGIFTLIGSSIFHRFSLLSLCLVFSWFQRCIYNSRLSCVRAVAVRVILISSYQDRSRSSSLLLLRRPLVSDILEPIWSAVFSLQPGFTIRKFTLLTASAFWRIRAVEEWNVLVTDVLEPASR